MHQTNDAPFGKLRSYLWPIHNYELKKLVPLFLMLFFVCFNYTILRNLKDTLVITAKGSGADVIPFIKVWVMLPAALLSTMAFTWLTNRVSRKGVFYLVIGFFLVFLSLFAFFIYPQRELLAADSLAHALQSVLPPGCKGFIAMVRNWPLTLFYVVAELWSTMVLTVLFWGFVNEITRVSEAVRFYGALNISSNTATIFAGQVAAILSIQGLEHTAVIADDAWTYSIEKMTLLMLFCGACILAIFHWMTRHVLNNPVFIPQEERKQKKARLTFRQSLMHIAGSKYLLCIATIVVSYNLVIHMVEVIWKDRLSQVYPNPNEYNAYTNNLTSIMAMIAVFAAVFMASIIRKIGWTNTALITPIVLFVTTAAFFLCLLAETSLAPFVSAFLGTTPVALAVFLGSMQNCFTKAAKYSLFDTTKEMAFIPLDPEQKLKSKAAIDGIGSRLGKSGGSLIHQGLMVLFLSLSASTPYVAAILLAVILLWVFSVGTLGKLFQKETEGEKQDSITYA